MAALTIATIGPARNAHGQELAINQPPTDQYVVDLAQLLEPTDEQQIQTIAQTLLADQQTPLMVVTINAMADHTDQADRDMRIETFARVLFDQWQTGWAKINTTPWHTGILLLISANDRQMRIELGAGWEHKHIQDAKRIIDDLITPKFRDGHFADGIKTGVLALNAMARDQPIPKKPIATRTWVFLGIAVALVAFTVVSIYRRGGNGWATLMWGAVFGFLGYLLYIAITGSSKNASSTNNANVTQTNAGNLSSGGGATGSW